MYTAIQKKPYICFADVPQAQRQTYIKRRYLTLCSQHIEIWPFQKATVEQQSNGDACVFCIYARQRVCCIHILRGLRRCSFQLSGEAKATMCGTGNKSKTRAICFYITRFLIGVLQNGFLT